MIVFTLSVWENVWLFICRLPLSQVSLELLCGWAGRLETLVAAKNATWLMYRSFYSLRKTPLLHTLQRKGVDKQKTI